MKLADYFDGKTKNIRNTNKQTQRKRQRLTLIKRETDAQKD